MYYKRFGIFEIEYDKNNAINCIISRNDIMDFYLEPMYINTVNNINKKLVLNRNTIYLNYGIIEKIANDIISNENNHSEINKIFENIFNNIVLKHLEYLETIQLKGYDYK